MASLNLVEISIDDLQNALTSGLITSVELVARYLHRISKYDSRDICLNSIPVLNPNVFQESAASDERRRAGLPPRPLEGIPFTVKDSYKVKGMTVASGSAAFQSLVANEDAFTVAQLRNAGAVLIGKTNMPPMAAGGMQRGVYGRAESPYNLEYLTAAYASGSSNGSATATSASFCAFGMAEETVSSGRSPASNNGLVAYTPSRGVISIRGNWPLYVTCDVIVPHTRTVTNLLTLLDVLVVKDDINEGDFWRSQPYVTLPSLAELRPSSFRNLKDSESLHGKRIGVPKMYISGEDPQARAVYTKPSVIALWKEARACLEGLGAKVVEDDFPVVSNYEKHGPHETLNVPGLPENWAKLERSTIIAYSWEDFLLANKDPVLSTPATIDTTRIFPRSIEEVQWKYSEMPNLVQYDTIFDVLKERTVPIYELPGCKDALLALEAARKRDLEDWMDQNNLDLVVIPANGDVGRADTDIKDESAKHAWMNGVKYSNGNRALRHLGIPTVTVTMGVMEDTKMPVGLTFVSRAYDDCNLLKYAYAYETASKKRCPPPLTPALHSDLIPLQKRTISQEVKPITLTVTSEKIRFGDVVMVKLSGHSSEATSLEVYVDGNLVDGVKMEIDGSWVISASSHIPEVETHVKTEATIPRDQVMVVVLARSHGSVVAGALALL
ncbi:hypothetical protein B7463_g12618, partial [Scytalidium lignicola]